MRAAARSARFVLRQDRLDSGPALLPTRSLAFRASAFRQLSTAKRPTPKAPALPQLPAMSTGYTSNVARTAPFVPLQNLAYPAGPDMVNSITPRAGTFNQIGWSEPLPRRRRVTHVTGGDRPRSVDTPGFFTLYERRSAAGFGSARTAIFHCRRCFALPPPSKNGGSRPRSLR